MEIKDIFKKLSENQDEIYSVLCSVIEVDESQRTIHAKPLNGSAEIFDVRLQTMLSGVIGIVNFPKVGSDVIVNFISKEVAYVALNSEIKKIQLNIGEMSFFVDATNANLEVENVSVTASDTSIDSQGVSVDCEVMTVNATETNFNSDTFKITGTLAEIIATAIKMTGAVALNGGLNGGVPKSASLVAEINKLKQDFQDLKAKFTAWVPLNNDGGARLKTQLNSWSPNITAIAEGDISNPQNTH